MTIMDYLLLVAAIAAALYTSYRLFLGYLRSRSEEMAIAEGDKVSPSSERPPTHNGSATRAPWRARD